MLAKLLLLFTIIPIVELAILIPLGEAIGIGPTVALVLVTGILGAVLAKRQGMAAWRRVREDLGAGRVPGDSLLDGLAVLIAGAFLVTPGVLTDVAGMFLLIPPLRRPLKSYLKTRFTRSLESGTVSFIQFGGPFSSSPLDGGRPSHEPSADDFEEGEIIDVTPEASETKDARGTRLN